jgi:hypothetical protein
MPAAGAFLSQQHTLSSWLSTIQSRATFQQPNHSTWNDPGSGSGPSFIWDHSCSVNCAIG